MVVAVRLPVVARPALRLFTGSGRKFWFARGYDVALCGCVSECAEGREAEKGRQFEAKEWDRGLSISPSLSLSLRLCVLFAVGELSSLSLHCRGFLLRARFLGGAHRQETVAGAKWSVKSALTSMPSSSRNACDSCDHELPVVATACEDASWRS